MEGNEGGSIIEGPGVRRLEIVEGVHGNRRSLGVVRIEIEPQPVIAEKEITIRAVQGGGSPMGQHEWTIDGAHRFDSAEMTIAFSKPGFHRISYTGHDADGSRVVSGYLKLHVRPDCEHILDDSNGEWSGFLRHGEHHGYKSATLLSRADNNAGSPGTALILADDDAVEYAIRWRATTEAVDASHAWALAFFAKFEHDYFSSEGVAIRPLVIRLEDERGGISAWRAKANPSDNRSESRYDWNYHQIPLGEEGGKWRQILSGANLESIRAFSLSAGPVAPSAARLALAKTVFWIEL